MAGETESFGQGIAQARERLPGVDLDPRAEALALNLVRELEIPSHRAEIVTMEAARAHAAADERQVATVDDVIAVAPMSLRQRRSEFIQAYFQKAETERVRIKALLHEARQAVLASGQQRGKEVVAE